ncbi:MAG TPA: type II secretion system F family protein [Azoarcus taiwanensis]|uniref:type II secretion system F family protein n=1 Tax=Azoarcus taiwanensis TaxID=666964 RepID=UPI001FE7728C|nr:type II secretion system F family protein [Azoarcus taiwanensis]HRQ55945.1 type II secretion system F family protein [Azoarcus taiwanensis]
MTPTALPFELVLLAVALTIALATWALIDIGARLMHAWRTRFTRDTGFHLRELFLFVDPARLYALNLALTVLVAGSVWLGLGSLTLALVVAALLAISPGLIFRWLRARRIARIEAQLPDALQMLAGTARAGLSLPAAIRQVTTELAPPLSQELMLVQHEQRLGVSLDDALENLSFRVPAQPVKLMVSAMRIASETGGGLAETLERTATTLRSQHAMELKIGALTAQGKLQAWVVGLLPVFLLWALTRMEPDAMALLWTTRIGWGVLAAVAIMEFFGVLLIRRIVSIDV